MTAAAPKGRPRKLPAALRLEVVGGRELGLRCLCGFTLRQAAREPIAPCCPKCGRPWR
jgi:hypothetical protein